MTWWTKQPHPRCDEVADPNPSAISWQCEEHGRLYKVTVRIYNLLKQVVAVPLLQEGSGSGGTGQPLENVLLSCDRYVAYWDGKAQNTAEPVPRGIYLYVLEVDGSQKLRRMFVRR